LSESRGMARRWRRAIPFNPQFTFGSSTGFRLQLRFR
jgi:hypothetical protein